MLQSRENIFYPEEESINDIENKNLGRVRRFCKIFGVEIIGATGYWILAPIFVILAVFIINTLFIFTFYGHVSVGIWIWHLFSFIIFMFVLLWTSFTDPGHFSRENGSEFISHYCDICYTIDNDKVKHCGACRICIKGYDHHCVVLGNCIGEKNIICFYLTSVMFLINFFLMALIASFFLGNQY